MSERYEQPERGSYTDRWDIVLNRNFAEIGDDIDQLFATTETEPWVDVTAHGADGEGNTDDTAAIQSAIDTYNVVYLPAGTYGLTDSLVISDATRIIGAGARQTHLTWLGDSSDTTSDIIQFTDTNRKAGSSIERLYITNAPRDAINIQKAHEWFVDHCWINESGRYGINIGASWKGGVFRTLTNNAPGGIIATGESQATSIFNSHALGNDIGMRPGAQGTIAGSTLEANDTDILVETGAVCLSGNYHEPESGNFDPANPTYAIHACGTPALVVNAGGPLVRKGIGIMIENSHVTINNPRSGRTNAPSGNDYDFSNKGMLAWYADADSTVHVNGMANAPFNIEDIGNVFFSRMNRIRSPSDALNGAGDFSGTVDANGFAGSWYQSRGATGTVLDSGIYGNTQQVTVPTGISEYSGVTIDVSLDANTTYTLGGWLDTDIEVAIADDGNSRLGGHSKFPNAAGRRFTNTVFTTDSTPTTEIRIIAFGEYGTFKLDGFKLVEGVYGVHDFPFLE